MATTSRSTKRADAARNIERALDAAITCLSQRPNATMAEIAKEAGIGRVTLYAHFASRAELLEAVVTRVIEAGERTLSGIDLDGDPRGALTRLITGSWQLVDQARSIIAAAEGEIPPERMRALHGSPAARVEALIARGRQEGSIRADMPATWQVAVLHQILHGAGAEVAAGRLEPNEAPGLIITTVNAILDPH
ncbi:TetR/AcrR family transcriptional regulator [Nesterenkonia sphaerica]|uniref:TetR/AcrR family transcriptional regulator n=1 Tax=Nesterenkonia sphaerica TaxID=1804988 RepID=A0A5R8ZZS5_9MICC|nr:TetR/AcrR family transcriptional regulator [Nesterenkonia sphaerica]TLP71750.1 TetR/AcrR family transcriptional regulator [Nesterenkonia sphaerica]